METPELISPEKRIKYLSECLELKDKLIQEKDLQIKLIKSSMEDLLAIIDHLKSQIK